MPNSSQSDAANGPLLKRDAPLDVVEAVERLERAADECYIPLALLKTPANLAIWSLLTYSIAEHTEKELNEFGPGNHDFTGLLINLSRTLPTAIHWISKHGRPASRLVPLRWVPKLQQDSRTAFGVAHHYNSFLYCLPMWHCNRYAVDLLSPVHARFTVPGPARQRQVSAYQKGYKPRTGAHAISPSGPAPQSPELIALFQKALESASGRKQTSFSYGEPFDLWQNMFPVYLDRVNTIARRDKALVLGGYTLEGFNRFFGALTAIAAAHEFLCFAWGKQHGTFPNDAAVIVRLRSDWVRVLARLSGLTASVATTILDDLTFDVEKSIDLTLQPFVPLGTGSPWLGVAPPFPLSSRPDENILRIMSLTKNTVFSETSNSKEDELRDAVKATCPQFSPQGPRTLPKPLPDIDLIMTDEVSSTLVICEAKWIRKTVRAVEHIDRDQDVEKGFGQLGKIRDFLVANPLHLKQLKTLPKAFDLYQNVYFVVLARDHWLWREPDQQVAILEFEAFVRIISKSTDLHVALDELLHYEWLPVQGADFTVRTEKSRAGTVLIESEIFYALPLRHTH